MPPLAPGRLHRCYLLFVKREHARGRRYGRVEGWQDEERRAVGPVGVGGEDDLARWSHQAGIPGGIECGCGLRHRVGVGVAEEDRLVCFAVVRLRERDADHVEPPQMAVKHVVARRAGPEHRGRTLADKGE